MLIFSDPSCKEKRKSKEKPIRTSPVVLKPCCLLQESSRKEALIILTKKYKENYNVVFFNQCLSLTYRLGNAMRKHVLQCCACAAPWTCSLMQWFRSLAATASFQRFWEYRVVQPLHIASLLKYSAIFFSFPKGLSVENSLQGLDSQYVSLLCLNL